MRARDAYPRRMQGMRIALAAFVVTSVLGAAACDRRGNDITTPRDDAGAADDTPGGMNTPPADTTTNPRGSTP